MSASTELHSFQLSSEQVKALGLIERWPAGFVEPSPIEPTEARRILELSDRGQVVDDAARLRAARAHQALVERYGIDWLPTVAQLFRKQEPKTAPPVSAVKEDFSPGTWNDLQVTTFSNPQIVRFIPFQFEEEQNLQGLWILNFSGIHVYWHRRNDTHFFGLILPDRVHSFMDYLSGFETVADEEAFKQLIDQLHTVDASGFANRDNPLFSIAYNLTQCTMPFDVRTSLVQQLTGAQLHFLGGIDLPRQFGYPPETGLELSPDTVPYSQRRLPFPPIKEALLPPLVTLQQAEVIGHVAIRSQEREEKGKVTDFWLVDFSGVFVVVYAKKEHPFSTTIIGKEDRDEARKLIPPLSENRVLSAAKAQRLLKELHRVEVGHIRHRHDDLYHRSQTNLVIAPPPFNAGELLVERLPRYSLEVYRDPALLGELGFEEERLADPSRYEVRTEYTFLPFPYFERDLLTKAGLYPEGVVHLKGGKELAHVLIPDGGDPHEARFFDFSGIIVYVRLEQGEMKEFFVARPYEGERLRSFLKTIGTYWQDEDGPVLLTSSSEQYFFHGTVQTVFYFSAASLKIGRLFGLEGIIERQVSLELDEGVPTLVVDNKGPLLETIGYDPTLDPDIQTTREERGKEVLPFPPPDSIGPPTFLFRLLFRDPKGRVMEYCFLDFEGVLVVGAFDQGSPEFRDIFILPRKQAPAILEKYRTWASFFGEGIIEDSQWFREIDSTLQSEGLIIDRNRRGPAKKETTVHLFDPIGDPRKEEWLENLRLRFASSKSRFPLWGWRGELDKSPVVFAAETEGSVREATGVEFPPSRAVYSYPLFMGAQHLTSEDPGKVGDREIMSLYLLDLQGLCFLYIHFRHEEKGGKMFSLYLVPPSLRQAAIDLANIKNIHEPKARFGDRLDGLISNKKVYRFFLQEPQNLQQIVFGNAFRLILPPVTDKDDYPTYLHRWELHVGPDIEELERLGFENREETLFQTRPFEPTFVSPLGIFYFAGKNLPVFYEPDTGRLNFLRQADLGQLSNLLDGGKVADTAAFLELIHQAAKVVRFYRGGRFLRADQLPSKEVDELSYTPDVLSALPELEVVPFDIPLPGEYPPHTAQVRLPLVPELTERLGIPHQSIFLLTPHPTRRSRDERQTFYQAGPFDITVEHVDGGADAYSISHPGVIAAAALRMGITEPAAIERATFGQALPGRPLLLYVEGSRAMRYVPLASLHGTLRAARLVSLIQFSAETSTPDRYFRDQAVADTRGIKVVGAGPTPWGNVLVIKPADGLGFYWGLPGAVDAQALGAARSLSISYLLDETFGTLSLQGEVDPLLARLRDESLSSGPIQLEYRVEEGEYPAGTPLPLLPDGFEAPLKVSLILPEGSFSSLRGGQTIIIQTGNTQSLYQLRPRPKRRDFDLYQEAKKVGTLEVTGPADGKKRITLTIGDKRRFVVTGLIPMREVFGGKLILSGTNGPEGLAAHLHQLVGHMRKEGRHGEADSIERIIASWRETTSGEATSGETGSFVGIRQIASLLSVYNAKITLETEEAGQWRLTVERNETTPDSVFEDFIEVAEFFPLPLPLPEWERDGERVISAAADARDDEPLHQSYRVPLTYSKGDHTVRGEMLTTGDMAEIRTIAVHWQGRLVPLSMPCLWQWEIVRNPKTEKWSFSDHLVEVSSEPVTAEGVSYHRDYLFVFGSTGIKKLSWVEHRSYTLPSGEKISFDLKEADDGSLRLTQVFLVEKSQKISLTPSKTKLKWGESLELTGGQKVYPLTLGAVPSANDLSQNLIQRTEVPLPNGAGTLMIVWELVGKMVRRIEVVSGGQRTVILPNRVSLDEQNHFEPLVDLTIPPFGVVRDRLRITFSDGEWKVTSPLSPWQSSDGTLQGLGSPTADSYHLKYFSPRPADWPADGIALAEGERRYLREYRFENREGALLALPLISPQLPENWVSLGEEGFSLRRFARVGEEEAVHLPLGMSQKRFLDRGKIVELIGEISPQAVFYPTLESLERMALRIGTVSLTFQSASTPLIFSADFVFKEGAWHPLSLLDNARTVWNEERFATRISRRNGKAFAWQPVPPLTTQLQSLPVPGRENFFVLFNATGATPFETAERQRAALQGFEDYLSVQAAGMVSGSPRRFEGEAIWEGEQEGIVRVSLREFEMGEGGVSPTGKTISFGGKFREGIFQFVEGRTEVVVREETGELWRGFFEVHAHLSRHDFLLTQIDPSPGSSPRLFRFLLTPHGDPIITEISSDELTLPVDPLFEGELAVVPSVPLPASGGEGVAAAEEGAVTATRIVFEGNIRPAHEELLPYHIDERRWKEARTIDGAGELEIEAAAGLIHTLQGWFEKGGFDFQFLPESIGAFRQGGIRLEKLIADHTRGETPLDRKALQAALSEAAPLELWFMNRNGVRLQIILFPYLFFSSSAKSSIPQAMWVLTPAGEREGKVPLRFVGSDPADSSQTVQVLISAHYQRNGRSQELALYDPTSASQGILHKLSMIELEQKEGSSLPLLSFVDVANNRPKTERERVLSQWVGGVERRGMARLRMEQLAGMVEEAGEVFVVAGEPQLIQGEEGEIERIRWPLQERFDAGEGGNTGKRLFIEYPLPQKKGEALVMKIPSPLVLEEVQRHRQEEPDEYPEDEPVKPVKGKRKNKKETVSVPYHVYLTRDHSLLLVDQNNPNRRFILSFETEPGREGMPRLRRLVRGYESADQIADFYAPPRWDLFFHRERAISPDAAFGLARVEDVTEQVRAERSIPEGGVVHRYRFAYSFVEGKLVESRFDLLLDEQGKIIKIFDTSWQLSGFDLDDNHVATDVHQTEDGKVSLYLRHRPMAQSEAVGQTHFMRIDLSPDPETKIFLDHHVSVEEMTHLRYSDNPGKFFLPSETNQRFDFVRSNREGVRTYPTGYLVSSPSPEGMHFRMIFYVEDYPEGRREVEFVLGKNGAASFSHVVPGSLKLRHMQTGELLRIGVDGSISAETRDGTTEYHLDYWPFRLTFYLDDEGRLPKNLDEPFRLIYGGDRYVDRGREVPPEFEEWAEEIFSQTFGTIQSRVQLDDALTVDFLSPHILGQNWVSQKLTRVEKTSDSEERLWLEDIWFAACLQLATQLPSERKGQQLSEEEQQSLVTVAEGLFTREWDAIEKGGGFQKWGRSRGGKRYLEVSTRARREEVMRRGLGLQVEIDLRDVEEARERFGEFVEEAEAHFASSLKGERMPEYRSALKEARRFIEGDDSKTWYGTVIAMGIMLWEEVWREGNEGSLDHLTDADFWFGVSELIKTIHSTGKKIDLHRERLAEIILSLVLTDKLDRQFKEDILYALLTNDIFKDYDHLKVYRGFVLEATDPGLFDSDEDWPQVFKYVVRPKTGHAEEKEYYRDDVSLSEVPEHPVAVWMERHHVQKKHWSDPVGLPPDGKGKDNGAGKSAKPAGDNSPPPASFAKVALATAAEPLKIRGGERGSYDDSQEPVEESPEERLEAGGGGEGEPCDVISEGPPEDSFLFNGGLTFGGMVRPNGAGMARPSAVSLLARVR